DIGDLHGATLGIIGEGAIGQSTAAIGRAFGMRVLFADHPPPKMPGVTFTPHEEVLAQSDVISLHCPLLPSTRNLIDIHAFRKMKRNALLTVFDNVVGFDGGADPVSAYGGVDAKNVGGLVEGAIFTRGLKDKKNTAIFIGGGNLAEGEAVLAAVRRKFFGKFRVSVLFDCNGSN